MEAADVVVGTKDRDRDNDAFSKLYYKGEMHPLDPCGQRLLSPSDNEYFIHLIKQLDLFGQLDHLRESSASRLRKSADQPPVPPSIAA